MPNRLQPIRDPYAALVAGRRTYQRSRSMDALSARQEVEGASIARTSSMDRDDRGRRAWRAMMGETRNLLAELASVEID
jgi:hypothetical protein